MFGVYHAPRIRGGAPVYGTNLVVAAAVIWVVSVSKTAAQNVATVTETSAVSAPNNRFFDSLNHTARSDVSGGFDHLCFFFSIFLFRGVPHCCCVCILSCQPLLF